jgi:hypothetical protein
MEMMHKTARLQGFMKASSSLETNNPLQSRVTLVLTDFEPNINKQGVPSSEKKNIMQSALYMPLKVNFDGEEIYGHTTATPLGPITKVWEDQYNGRDVILGEAVIWNEHYKAVSEHIKKLFDTGIGTSWEIYYADSEVDSSGVEWLHDCVFAGSCIVDTPAYGPERTRILAIAQALQKTEGNETMNKANADMGDMGGDMGGMNTPMDTPMDAPTSTDTPQDAPTELDTLRADISTAMDTLCDIMDVLSELFDDVDDIEVEQNEANITTITSQLSQLVSNISSRVSALQVGYSELKDAEVNRAKASLVAERRNHLANAGVVYTDDKWAERIQIIGTMDDTTFKAYADDMSSVVSKVNKATAEVSNPLIPEPVGNTNAPSILDLASALRNVLKKS